MKNKFLVNLLPLILSCISFSIHASELSYSEIRATGKNLVTMSGFYSTCSKKKLIEPNSKAIRYASFFGAKYMLIAGIESEFEKWIILGTEGTLINDPTESEKSLKVEINKKHCEYVKNVIDTNYKIADNYISGNFQK